MPLGPSNSAICVQNTSQANHSTTPPRPTSLTIHPTALFSILDHYLRRTDRQHRVIGTLLGTRPTPSTVSVTHAFAVLHSETEEQVAVDMEYHRSMFEMFLHIVGWYATGGAEKQASQGLVQGQDQNGLGTYSALIQNFYEQETAPYPAVHVALDTGTEEGVGAGVRAYVSSPVGVTPRAENCVFVPIPCELRFRDTERAGLDLLLSSATSPNGTAAPTTPLSSLHDALLSTSSALSRVLAYVQAVLHGTVRARPCVRPVSVECSGHSTGRRGRDTLMVSYLANLVRGEAEVAARLVLAGGT
ncbi:Mov34-domain-containing protein [Pisolithus croceorrhizus]|nr:Mov34-domain-containing protein [Pisolithus croceorrhizus]